MHDLNEIHFKDFITLHKINPKIYMLKCDKFIVVPIKSDVNLDDTVNASVTRRS